MKAKKSLGQNFLNSPSAIRRAVETAQIKKGELVVEIGPGRGKLTEALLKSGARVIAIEKDKELFDLLKKSFISELKNGQLTLINDDILEVKPRIFGSNYKVVANIPYYITGQILRKFLSAELQPELMVLMMQKEVAERIVARDNKESLLSLSVRAFGDPRYIVTVPAGAFLPPPKVDSALILIERISKKRLGDLKEEKLFEVLKLGFGQKRKQLKSNLKLSEVIFQNCKVAPQARAEDLDLENWLCLTKHYGQKS